MANLYCDLRKCKSELRKVLKENDKLKKDKKTKERLKHTVRGLNDTVQGLNDTVNNLEAVNRELQVNYQKELEEGAQIVLSTRIAIRNLNNRCCEKIEEIEATLNEKDRCILKKHKLLQDAEEVAEKLKEKKKCMEKELEQAKAENQKFRDELKAAKLQKNSSDTISDYKRKHYCCVCEKSAIMTCCLNTSYCSLECQEKHAGEHKYCEKKITSQIFVQQRVVRRQAVVRVSHGVITSGKSPVTNPAISEVSEINSPTVSTPKKKPKMHGVSASPLLPTSHYHVKRRSCK